MAPRRPKGPELFQPAYDSRRVQPLAGWMRVRVFDHLGRGRQVEADPVTLRDLVAEIAAADEHCAGKVEAELTGWGFEVADVEGGSDD